MKTVSKSTMTMREYDWCWIARSSSSHGVVAGPIRSCRAGLLLLLARNGQAWLHSRLEARRSPRVKVCFSPAYTTDLCVGHNIWEHEPLPSSREETASISFFIYSCKPKCFLQFSHHRDSNLRPVVRALRVLAHTIRWLVNHSHSWFVRVLGLWAVYGFRLCWAEYVSGVVRRTAYISCACRVVEISKNRNLSPCNKLVTVVVEFQPTESRRVPSVLPQFVLIPVSIPLQLS